MYTDERLTPTSPKLSCLPSPCEKGGIFLLQANCQRRGSPCPLPLPSLIHAGLVESLLGAQGRAEGSQEPRKHRRPVPATNAFGFLWERQTDMLRLEHSARDPMKMGGNQTEPEPQWGMRPLRRGSVGWGPVEEID